MSNSPSNQPIRSISLPTRPHPLVPQIDEQLSILRSSFVEPTSLLQLTSLSHKLSCLKSLYDCLDDLILLPQNQSKLIQSSYTKGDDDDLFEGSLRLLDMCSVAKDALSQLKGHVQELQSSLRRRSNGELNIFNEVMDYLSMRKNIKAMIKRCLKDVKGLSKGFVCQREKYDGNVVIVDLLKEVEGVTFEIFESLLEVIGGSKKGQSLKRSSTSFSFGPFALCKLVMDQIVVFDKREVTCSLSEIKEVDLSLSCLINDHKKKMCVNVVQVENLRSQMVKLDSSIQDLDEVLEGLFRCLVKTRATLLNVLSF